LNPIDDDLSLDQIRDCLERSGYLLESRLVRSLTDRGYFVEPNVSISDPRSGKAREIDLVAEYYRYNPDRPTISVHTYFVIEAINNRLPFVLVTQRPPTPGTDIESYVKYICTPDPSPFIEELDIYGEKEIDWENLFSQFCALTWKSGNREVMATHPDDVYGSLLKLSEYVEDTIEFWASNDWPEDDDYWRLWFWQPTLVLGGRLIASRLHADGGLELRDTAVGHLEFNWHAGDQPRTTLIDVVTEGFLLERLAKVVGKDEELSQKVFAVRQQQQRRVT
jgi:hypothetical protein